MVTKQKIIQSINMNECNAMNAAVGSGLWGWVDSGKLQPILGYINLTI